MDKYFHQILFKENYILKILYNNQLFNGKYKIKNYIVFDGEK